MHNLGLAFAVSKAIVIYALAIVARTATRWATYLIHGIMWLYSCYARTF